jgi:endonuclease/exonuclease/phosphatase family metal-dependent hydrolase
MPKLTDLQDADRQYDPYSNENARDLISRENEAGISAGIDQAEAFANDPRNSSTEKVKSLEEVPEVPNEFGFEPSSKTEQPKKLTLKGVLKSRKAASGGIIGTIIALVGFFGTFITPGIAAVQMKEILTDDLNDQLGAMDRRTAYVMRAKLNDIGKGVCTGVKINCGFKGMSDRQLNKFKAAGIDVETDGKTAFGKNKIKSMTFTGVADGTITNPREVNKLLANSTVRNQLRKAFNPKFAGFFDAKWDSFKQRFRLTSTDKLGTGSDEDKKSRVTSAVKGDPLDIDAADRVNPTDPDGKPDPEADNKNKLADRANNAVNSEGVSTKSLLGSAGKGALKGVGVLGAADVACTVKNTARAVEAGAKIYRYKQLMAYSMVFLTFADQIKAGTATPEQAEFVGNTLTAVDTDKTVVDEDGETEGDSVKEKENPYYGANAFDSAGYKTAMYNEAPTLSARDMQMAVGGGVALGMLSKVNGFIDKYGGGNCRLIQNWAVRGGSLVIGIALGAITAGAATVASVTASVAISMALPILENYLAQMTAGTVANGDTKGVDTGNAIFAGTAALMGGMAMTRGMKPAKKEDLKTYLAMNEEVQNEYIAMETEEASKTPLDINNRYSFLGSLTRSLLPLKTTSSVSAGNSILNGLAYLISTPLKLSTVSAQSSYNEDRYSKCEDNGYKELGIDADVFCNVRYTMSPYELSLDTDEVRAQMLAWGQVNDDEAGSVVTGSDYESWLAECTEREQGWGETEAENQEDGDGTRCMGTEKKDSYYRVYTMDASIIAAMDYVPPTSSAALSGGSNLRAASFNVRGLSHTNGDNKDEPTTEASTWENRIKYTAQTITTNNLEVIGFQEFEPAQRDYIRNNVANFEISTHGKESDAIGWDTNRFKKVDEGTWQTTYFEGPIDEPWVKLQDIATQQEFYVLSVHDPINRGKGNAESRTENAKKHLAMVNQLKTNAPVILLGDFNSGYTKEFGAGAKSNDKLAYCILTAGGTMNDAYDLSIPRPAKCPNEPTNGTKNYIDHIYLTPEMQVGSFKELQKGYTNNGSDHPTIYADVVIPGSESAGLGKLTIATHNVLTSFFGGPTKELDEADKKRYANVAKFYNEKKWSIIGAQEIRADERKEILKTLTGYGVTTPTGDVSDVVFYDSALFTEEGYGSFKIPKSVGTQSAIWVKLKAKATGSSLYVFNMHAMVGSGTGAQNERTQDAQIVLQKIKELVGSSGDPYVVLGDMNSNYSGAGRSQVYDVFKASGMLNSTYHATTNRSNENCDTHHDSYPNKTQCRSGLGSHIDQIWVSKQPAIKVNSWANVADTTTIKLSDHSPVVVELDIPGLTPPAAGGGGIVWPVPGVKQMGILPYGKPNTSGLIHKGVDIGISGGGAFGKTVVATHTGVVDRVWGESDGCGAYVSIKAAGTGYYAAYQHLDGDSILVKAGNPVKAGQPIGKIGKQGGSTCGSRGFYHLHYSIESNPGSVSAYADPFPNGTKDPLEILPKP